MARGLFITGTGTGVGKTYVAALIARALREAGERVGVYKPVASGCELRDGELVSPDAVALVGSGRPAGNVGAGLSADVCRAACAASGGAGGRPARRSRSCCAMASNFGARRAMSCSSKAPAD